MRKIFGLLCLLTALSCREPLLESTPRFMREQDRFARNVGQQKDQVPADPGSPGYTPSLYVTALHFRDSVDWRRDSLGAAEVLFFKNGELVRQEPVASPPDPERHRIWKGQLWTDYTDGRETVLLCNGEERLRYEGEELLRGFLLLDGDIHTLGQRPGNEGFCYRINGKVIYSRDKATILGGPSAPEWRGGALMLDDQQVYYSFSVPVQLKDKIGREYHVMRGGDALQTIPVGTYDALYDLRVRGGVVWMAARRGEQVCLVCGDKEYYLNVSGNNLFSYQLVPYGEEVMAKGNTLHTGQICTTWYYEMGQLSIKVFRTGRSQKVLSVLGENNRLFVDVDTQGLVTQFLRNDVDECIPRGQFTCAMPLDLFASGEHYAAAFTHISDTNHLVICDGEQFPYSFNGYFTSVIVE